MIKSGFSPLFLVFLVFFFKIKRKRAIIWIAEKGGIFMTKVMVRNGNVDGALRTLKVDKDGSRKKIRENIEGYLKPGVRRRRKKEEGIRNTKRRNRRENRSYNSFSSNHYTRPVSRVNDRKEETSGE